MTTFTSHSLASTTPTVVVWDRLVRIFHWSLVGFFSFSYFTGDDGGLMHHWSGYAIVGLLIFRLVWGLIGPKHARFTDFVRHPKHIKAYLLDLKNGQAKRHLGHNPAGGIMVVFMLLGLMFMGFSGMLLAGFEGYGVLAGTAFMALDVFPVKDLHELMANLLVTAIIFHIAGVILSSKMHHENLVKAMFTGRKNLQVKDHD